MNEHVKTAVGLLQVDVDLIGNFIQQARLQMGSHWGCLVDLKDNITRVLRCIYCDHGGSGFEPFATVPLSGGLSFRSSAVQREKPTYLARLNAEDPASFYIRRRLEEPQILMLPIRADTSLGLLTFFSTQPLPQRLGENLITGLFQQVQPLVEVLQRMQWQKEQEVLLATTQTLRAREIPLIVRDWFQRFLNKPVVLLKHLKDGHFQTVDQTGDQPLAHLPPICRLPL